MSRGETNARGQAAECAARPYLLAWQFQQTRTLGLRRARQSELLHGAEQGVAGLGTEPRGRQGRMKNALDLAENGARPGDSQDSPWRCGAVTLKSAHTGSTDKAAQSRRSLATAHA
jgi:hypothetical protein